MHTMALFGFLLCLGLGLDLTLAQSWSTTESPPNNGALYCNRTANRSDNFIVTVRGIVSAAPQQFAINLISNQTTHLHLSTRWNENRTVLNTYEPTSGWGPEEVAHFTPLRPGSTFTLTIRAVNRTYSIYLNKETATFRERCLRHWAPVEGVALATSREQTDVLLTFLHLHHLE